ncbi:MAG: alanine racemase [Bacillota bacterium]|nr:alanine racemase [Bacillota bacterium]
MGADCAVPRTIRPVWAEVNLDNLAHNVREIRRRIGPEAQIMAVVKANAYGHGAGPVARVALESGATWLGVALVEEAYELRREGIEAPIHLLSMPSPEQAEAVVAGGFSCAVCAVEVAEALSAAAVRLGRPARVQIKIDTGMGRLGLLPDEAPEFRRYLESLPGIELLGAFTHFASADETDKTYTWKQFETFQRALSACEGPPLLLAHAANSAAIIDLPELAGPLVRPGIMLYGLYPSAEVSRTAVDLRPVMSLKARVAYVKRLPAGAAVSYGRTYVTRDPETVALLPLGYADGFSRLLSGRAEVLLKGRRVPLRGRICMDQCVVGVPDGLEVRVGDEAVIFGRQGGEEITVDEVAERIGTINYEVVCAVSGRVPRVYLRQGRVSEIRSFLPEMAVLTP